MPQRKKDVYGGADTHHGLHKTLAYELGNVDFINYISSFDDSSKFMAAVNKDIKIIDTQRGEVLRTLTHPKQVTQCYAFNDDQNILSCCRDAIVRVYDLNNEGRDYGLNL